MKIMSCVIFTTCITFVVITNVFTAPITLETDVDIIDTNVASVPLSVILPESDASTILEQDEKLFEGDILDPPLSARSLVSRRDDVLWRDGIVPYEISTDYSESDQMLIESSMRQLENSVAINNVRCVQFRPREPNDIYFIRIVNGSGCSSLVGQYTNLLIDRTVSLRTPGCMFSGIIMHELLHTLGFFHEQSRPDRDSYIQVNTDNIQTDLLSQFRKYDTLSSDIQNTPYDYSSVMHYPMTAFSKNGLPTIVPLQSNVKIGQRYFLSSTDIASIRKFYSCSTIGITLPTPTIATTTTSNPSVVISTYTGALTSVHSSYTRPNGLPGSQYFYETIQITIQSAGIYQFESKNKLDTYASVYLGTFNASNPSANLFFQNDDQSQINWNFQFSLKFLYRLRLTLVISTYNPDTQGSYTFLVTGPKKVTIRPMTTFFLA